MAKASLPRNALADPTRLSALDESGQKIIHVIIETPKGSRNKYAFDPEHKIFEVRKVLPAGMAFPYDFGFIPSTLADDGDPVDVLVFMDEPAFPGVLLNCRVIGIIAIADAIRPTSKAAIAKLRERKIEVVMLTGDNAATAQRIAQDLGIDAVLADVLPAQKAEKIKELQATGKKVGMVGDGVNDAPAITQADVGFAIGAGTDVAMESADVVLMKSDPNDVVVAIELSHATLRKMHQNLWWAVGYNVIAFPLAAGVLYPFVLSPEVAAMSMSGSTLVVAINALMLKRTKLAGINQTMNTASETRKASVTAQPGEPPSEAATGHSAKKAAL